MFSRPFGLFQYTVMPFGLAPEPATIMRLMDEEAAEDAADIQKANEASKFFKKNYQLEPDWDNDAGA